MTDNKSFSNIKKQTLITLTATLLAFNGWAFIQAGEYTESSVSDIDHSGSVSQDHGRGGESQEGKKHARRGGMPFRPLGHFMDDLGVSDEQRDEVRSILRDERDQMHALHSDAEDQIDIKRVEARAATRTHLAEVLTEEQLARYDDMLNKTRLARHKKPERPYAPSVDDI